MENLLEVKNLSISFGHNTPLKNLSYSLKKGGTLSIAGESGSGKTISALALLNLLGGAAEVKGEILFEGRDVLKMPSKDLRALRGAGIGFVFQDPSPALNPVLTVYSQIEEVLLTHKICAKKQAHANVVNLLKETGLNFDKAKLYAYPHEFSGG